MKNKPSYPSTNFNLNKLIRKSGMDNAIRWKIKRKVLHLVKMVVIYKYQIITKIILKHLIHFKRKAKTPKQINNPLSTLFSLH
jgi:hypothetical protein